ncbi:hypothetical protein [Salinicola sp. CPA57]|uniref:hypothetical protein n=1 Tax=Salinicola sp. CPA57 TaxID=1949080 RepID=UPI001300306A|nr:hypothetical protein [Salinicola sp. CPA57]
MLLTEALIPVDRRSLCAQPGLHTCYPPLRTLPVTAVVNTPPDRSPASRESGLQQDRQKNYPQAEKAVLDNLKRQISIFPNGFSGSGKRE